MTHLEFEMKLKKDLGLRNRPTRFSNRDLAFNYAENCEKPRNVILGCDNKFWVVCFADTSKLLKQGYEFAS